MEGLLFVSVISTTEYLGGCELGGAEKKTGRGLASLVLGFGPIYIPRDINLNATTVASTAILCRYRA